MDFSIEKFDEQKHGHLVEELTALLHEAYKPLAQRGFRYSATHQSAETTAKRLKQGASFFAFVEGGLAGTISVYASKPDDLCEYYRKPRLFHFGQFAVRTDLQGKGIAREMLGFIERYARDQGGTELALDTAEGAGELVAMYSMHGFVKVGNVSWPATNYQSIVMTKRL